MAVLTRALPCVAAAAVLAAAAPARGSAQLTQDEALELAFPDAEISRRTAFLDEAETRRASELAGPGVEVESSVVTYYVALRGGEAIGVAYFDVHRVRTLPEVLMVVVGTDGRIRELETVSWKEPPEYRPPQGWLRQFQGQRLHEG
ncbi:MAG TPA: hypothetical protein VFQ22_00745, partial [Longimicrobiales bacterium]|nr:hypothetical protein [Longimicrobiales bacterium]